MCVCVRWQTVGFLSALTCHDLWPFLQTFPPALQLPPSGVFITKGDVGVGTIVGSAVFNILVIIGLSGIFAGQVDLNFDQRLTCCYSWEQTLTFGTSLRRPLLWHGGPFLEIPPTTSCLFWHSSWWDVLFMKWMVKLLYPHLVSWRVFSFSLL